MKSKALVHPFIDFLMIGGLSIIVYVFFYGLMFFYRDPGFYSALAYGAMILSLVINLPHFGSSYVLLYWDYRKKLTSSPMWIFVSIVVPVLLIGFCVVAFYKVRPQDLSYLIQAMFFFVGWHYVKQIFGCITVVCHRDGYELPKRARTVIKWNLFLLWAHSVLTARYITASHQFHSIPYTFNKVPSFLIVSIKVMVLMGFVAVVWSLWPKLKRRHWPPLNAVTAFVSIYVWYIPLMFLTAEFLLFVPLFHSLQYLLFVWGLKRNQHMRTKASSSMASLKKVSLFIFFSIAGGDLFMEVLPRFFDVFLLEYMNGFTFMLPAFLLVTNIHHYFIDHIIWRGSVPAVKANLLE